MVSVARHLAQALTGCGKDRIGDGGNDRRCPGLATQLAAAGSSLDRPKIAAISAPQRSTNARASTPAEILAPGLELRFPAPQLKRE
jgi:hypothetical protein